MVEMEGINLVQSSATLSYIARRLGMYPTKTVDQLFVDEICASATDARVPLMRYPWHGLKEKVEADFDMELYWGRWEREIPELGAFFLGAKVSLADVVVFEVLDFYEQIFGGEQFLRVMEPYPKLLRLYRKVVALNNIGRHRQYRAENYLPLPQYAKEVDQSLGR
jgi:glutathione S-transferase